MPIERSRRCASTVKPPTATRAMSSMPRVASGERDRLGVDRVALGGRRRVCTSGPSELGDDARSRRTARSTWVGARHLPRRDERELVEQALRVLDDADDAAGLCRPRARCRRRAGRRCEATPVVTATWSGPSGSARRRARASAGRRRRAGSGHAGRRWLIEPGIGERLVLDDVDAAEAVLAARRSAPARCGLGRGSVAMVGRGAEAGARPAAACWWPPPRRRWSPRPRPAMRPRISNCWRHSRRNSRHAQRTTARRAGTPPLPAPRRRAGRSLPGRRSLAAGPA